MIIEPDTTELTLMESAPPQAALTREYVAFLEYRLARMQLMMNLAQYYLTIGETKRAQRTLSQGRTE